MNSEDGGQHASDLQRQTAAAIARRKVLAAYTKSAQKAEQEARTAANAAQSSHLKDSSTSYSIKAEEWKKYHSAWQDYYRKYYSNYYSRAAQAYIQKERQKQQRERAEEERILQSLTQYSSSLKKDSGLPMNTKGSNPYFTTSKTLPNNDKQNNSNVIQKLRLSIREKASDKAQKNRRFRRFIPLFAGIGVTLLILFLQYNRLIFAPIMAYVSPGNAPASEIEAIDPTITQTVSAEPRLIIPKLNIDVPVRYGVQLSDVMSAMNNGVAHYRIAGASAYPGEVGNFVITGHSAGDIYSSNPYKYIFSGLERLDNNDLIYVNYQSKRYIYSVAKKEVIEPTNVAALTVATDKPILTLVTCTPVGTSRYRLLVTANQISPSPENAAEAEAIASNDQNTEKSLPANEPSFFEGVWRWLTGQ